MHIQILKRELNITQSEYTFSIRIHDPLPIFEGIVHIRSSDFGVVFDPLTDDVIVEAIMRRLRRLVSFPVVY
jgi:hypothetical protein